VWKTLRIAFLLLLLAIVALYSWADRRRMAEWDETVWIAVFPVNGDGAARTGGYLAGLTREQFADIRMFVLYHDPAQVESVPHSLGLQKGLLGVVYAYADPAAHATNNLVIAHEALHALGATDKYDPVTTLPLYPHGYGEPDAEPRHPQAFAEIMAGRVALSPREAQIPAGLGQAVIGERTAEEIGWLR
jgi:hypothetical protein